MVFGLPFVVVYLSIAWLLLTRLVFRVPRHRLMEVAHVRVRLATMGPMSSAERKAGAIFAITALLWITGDGMQLAGSVDIPGWRDIPGLGPMSDGAVAIASAIVLFLVRAPFMIEGSGMKVGPLMTWEKAERSLPWGILLLFGGGFAIASGIERTGLAQLMVDALAGYKDLHPAALTAGISGLVCVLSELGSNTATANLTLPILAESAVAWNMDPKWLLIPATLAATLGFALPVASPMQAIVFGSGRIPVLSMVRAGIWMDLAGILLLTLFFGFMR